jgi:hypothetical protein
MVLPTTREQDTPSRTPRIWTLVGDANTRSISFYITVMALLIYTGCSIWAVELLRREILKLQPDAKINAILIDFFLYDLAKEKEQEEDFDIIPHHRTRSIWY